jgi:hypothetical protein
MARLAWLILVLAAAVGLAPSTVAAQAFADWVRPTAPVRPVGDSGARGEVALMPTGAGDYELRASVAPGYRRLTWAVASGACAAWATAGAPAPRVLAEETPPLSGNWQLFRLRVARALTDSPLVLVGHTGDAGTPRACADLPVAEAHRRAAPAGAPPATARFVAADGAVVAGTARLWATPSGDLLLRADLSGTPGVLGWHVIEGTCDAWRHPDAWFGSPPLVTDRREQVVVVRSDGTEERRPWRRGARVLARPSGGGEMAIVVPAEWIGRTAEQELTVQAFVNVGGRGRLVACADLPIRAARGVTILPRAGTPVLVGWSLVVGVVLVVAGALVRGLAGRR